MKLLVPAAVAASLLAISPARAGPGITTDPCAALPQRPGEVADFDRLAEAAQAAGKPAPLASAAVNALRDEWQTQLKLADFFNLCRYRAANGALPKATPDRLVFMGDSITEGWLKSRPDFFRGDRVDRGISGQTTAHMLGRFYADVIALHPATVHILAGTNDIAGNSGPASLEMVENNIRGMVDLAQAHHVRVVLGTVLPAAKFYWNPAIDPVTPIGALNAWIRTYARTNRITLVDYYAALDDGRHGLSPRDSEDGVHPTTAGYAKMEAALSAALRRLSSAPQARAGRRHPADAGRGQGAARALPQPILPHRGAAGRGP